MEIHGLRAETHTRRETEREISDQEKQATRSDGGDLFIQSKMWKILPAVASGGKYG